MASSVAPPLPPGFVLEQDTPGLPEGFEFEDPIATDGDTIRDGDVRVRLQGVDAPELRQRGYLRDGTPVPIGVNSQSYLSEQLYSSDNLKLASQVGQSFGRIVGPVEANGEDIGLGSLRAGHSIAVPEYIQASDQLFNYEEAERLARQNRLGMHGVATLTPEQFRDDPNFVPEREWLAQHWDTPTPDSGLTAKEEQQWQALLRVGSAQQIAEYAQSVGYGIDEDRNARWVSLRDKFVAEGGDVEDFVRGATRYERGVRPMTDPGDGQLGASVRQYAKGLVAGGLEEVGGVVDALGHTPGRENIFNSDRRFADIVAGNIYQNQSITDHDEYKYPITSTAAQVAGGVTSAFALPYSAGARSVPQLAKIGGAYGATEGFLGTEGSLPNRLEGAAIGAPIGAIADPALGKLVDAAAPLVTKAVAGRGRDGQPNGGAPENAAKPPRPYTQDLVPVREPSSRATFLASTVQPKDILPASVTEALEEALPLPQSTEVLRGGSGSQIGNIDVSKLETPSDIKRALMESHRVAGGFDDATRGRITHEETEQLASELNLTPEALIARRNGKAFNAEEALAARQLLAKSADELVDAARKAREIEDPGDEILADFRKKWVRHVAIQEQVAGITAEAGRVLQQFKMSASSFAIKGEVLGAFVRAGGGKNDLQQAAGILLDAVEMGPGRFNALAERAAKPKWRDKISELYINSLLSNPPTHIVNMVSNSLTAIGQIPEYAVASSIGAARRVVMGKSAKERILSSEVGARTFGLVQGTKEGMQLFAKALRTGEADDFVSKVEGDEYKSISGLKGEIIRLPTRFLTAEDQIFKGIARRMEINAQAVRIANREGLKGDARANRIVELSANPTDEMFERALDYGRYLTFQRKLGGFGQSISGATQNSLAAKVVVPFVRTPINLLKFATERSPAAPLLREWRADFAAGGERRDLAMAKALIGTGLATVFYNAALEGRLTGAVPSDPKKAKLLYADGWQPYSVKVGDRYISYSRLDPLSTTLGVAADMATLPEGMSDKQKEDQGTLLVASIMGNLASKTWLSGVSSFVEGLSDPGRYADNWIERTISAFAVPAGVAGVSRAVDPTSRKSDSVKEAIKNRIPGLRDQQLPRRDVFGEVITLDSLGPDFISPFWQSQSKNDPVVAEMLRLDKGVSAPGKQYTQDGERLDYSPEEYDRYHEFAGHMTYSELLALIGSQRYSKMPDDLRRKEAQKAIASARRRARSIISQFGQVETVPAPPADFELES